MFIPFFIPLIFRSPESVVYVDPQWKEKLASAREKASPFINDNLFIANVAEIERDE